MKKLTIMSAIVMSGLIYSTANAQIKIRVGLHIGTPVVVREEPVYTEPVYNDDEAYYYMPDVDAYYSVNEQRYYYQDGGRWIAAVYLPGRFHDYNWRTARRYEVRAHRPYMHNEVYRSRYNGYAGTRNWNHDEYRGGGYGQRNNDRDHGGYGQPNRGQGGYDNRGQGGYGQPNRGQGGYDNRGQGGYGQPNRGQGGNDNRGQGGYGQPNRGQGGYGQPSQGQSSQPGQGHQGGGQGQQGGQGHQGGWGQQGQPANQNGGNGQGGQHYAQGGYRGHRLGI